MVTAHVVDGQIVNNGMSAADKAASEKEKPKESNSTLGKDAFLQLLVAQMKYQDPLNASNNSTEYVSQLATFSELESMQNLQDTAEQQRIQNLVGKSVILDVDGKQYTGQVDYLQYEDGETKICVGGKLYSADDVYRVMDSEYLAAYTQATEFISKLYTLPKLEEMTEADAKVVHELEDAYENMTDYGKSFIADAAVELLESYGPRADALSPRPVEVDYDKLAVEKLDELLGVMNGFDKDKTSLHDVLDQIATSVGEMAGAGSPGPKDDAAEGAGKTEEDGGPETENNGETGASGEVGSAGEAAGGGSGSGSADGTEGAGTESGGQEA